MATKKKSVKESLKAKAKAIKNKIKSKVKNKVKCPKCAGMIFAIFAFALSGCMTPEQASRSTHATVGDVESGVKVCVDEKANPTINVTVRFNFGDGAIASADSSGSSESQTQTPTFDISPKTDLRYNDALAAASTTSKGILETLTTAGMNKVLALMESGGSGQVTVQKKDGTSAVVTCSDGQCTTCSDCSDK